MLVGVIRFFYNRMIALLVEFSRQRFKYEGLSGSLSRIGIDHQHYQFNLPLIFTLLSQ